MDLKMKFTFSIVLIAAISISFPVFAKSAYIYEQDGEQGIWSLTGPSKDYKVANKYAPGTKLTIVAGTSSNGYTQVVDSRGRKSWVRSSVLPPTANVLLDQIRLDMSELKADHANQIKSLQSELSARAPLENMNVKLQSNIAEMQIELEHLRQANNAMSSRFNREVYFAGGVTILVGMLFGWVFGLRGKKRDSAWS